MPDFGIHEAKTQLSKLVERSLRGEDVMITRDGKPVVRLVPVEQVQKRAAPGLYAGQIRWDEDAFEPLTAEETAKLFRL